MAKWKLQGLVDYVVHRSNQAGLPDGRWVPARPHPMFWNFKERVKSAWDVFWHKADAVYWEVGEPRTPKTHGLCSAPLVGVTKNDR